MEKEVRHIDDCGPGLILAEDIFKNSALVMPKDAPLDDDTIVKLKAFGVEWIAVYVPGDPEETVLEPPPMPDPHREFKKQYRENVSRIKRVLHDLAAGRKLDMEQMEAVVNSAFSQVAGNYDLMETINEMRKTDTYTYTHGLNVSLYGGLMARWLGLPDGEIRKVIQAGVLHDIGKAKIPPQILNKKGPLSPEEMEQVKKHAALGYGMVQGYDGISQEVKETILMHHERVNGSGYPLGMTGEYLSLYTKIIMLADVYDALTSERVYKKRITPFDTFVELEKMGYDNFDPQVLLVFLSNIASYYTGAKVKLNTGEVGEIACILPQNITKPLIVVNGKCIDLSREPEYAIVEML